MTTTKTKHNQTLETINQKLWPKKSAFRPSLQTIKPYEYIEELIDDSLQTIVNK
jgi:hypothetical protein